MGFFLFSERIGYRIWDIIFFFGADRIADNRFFFVYRSGSDIGYSIFFNFQSVSGSGERFSANGSGIGSEIYAYSQNEYE